MAGPKLKITMRQQAILIWLRDHPGATMQQISEGSPTDLEESERWNARNRPGDDREWAVPTIAYPTVQQSMLKLIDLGLARREPERRGTADPPYQHYFVSMPESQDELEQAFARDAVEHR
jgi:hypothetical protein